MGRSRRFWILLCLGLGISLLLNLGGCDRPTAVSGSRTRLTIGLVSYDTGASSVDTYGPFQNYLEAALETSVELEPVFNEIRAVEQIQSQAWDLVFAPAGLAAIAMNDAQYIPIFPLQGNPKQRSVLVVKEEAAIASLSDLSNTVVALGEAGSATGYYLPLYDLYGLTLQEIRFAPTPKTVLEWVASDEVAAGALSEEGFQQYRHEFSDTAFRVLHESRTITSGAVLLSPTVDRNRQRLIEAAMKAAPSSLASDAGYIANAPVPDLSQLVQLVQKVRPLEERVREQPATLTMETRESPTAED